MKFELENNKLVQMAGNDEFFAKLHADAMRGPMPTAKPEEPSFLDFDQSAYKQIRVLSIQTPRD